MSVINLGSKPDCAIDLLVLDRSWSIWSNNEGSGSIITSGHWFVVVDNCPGKIDSAGITIQNRHYSKLCISMVLLKTLIHVADAPSQLYSTSMDPKASSSKQKHLGHKTTKEYAEYRRTKRKKIRKSIAPTYIGEDITNCMKVRKVEISMVSLATRRLTYMNICCALFRTSLDKWIRIIFKVRKLTELEKNQCCVLTNESNHLKNDSAPETTKNLRPSGPHSTDPTNAGRSLFSP